MHTTSTLETKSVSGAAFDDFVRTFEAFKDTNDTKLRELERRNAADVITTDKLDRLNAALDEHALKSQRPQLSSASADSFTSAPTFSVAVSSAEPGTQSFSHSSHLTSAFNVKGPGLTLASITRLASNTTSSWYS